MPTTSLKDAASEFGMDYQYFRDGFLKKVLGIYNGLNTEPLKDTDTRGLTEYGMMEVANYIKHVRNGKMSHAAYKQMVREEILKASSTPLPVVHLAATPTIAVVESDEMKQPPKQEEGLVLYEEETTSVIPIFNVTIENLQIVAPVSNTTAIDEQTKALQDNTGLLVNAIAGYVAADLESKMKTVLKQNENLAAGIQQAALASAAKNLGMGKTVNDGGS